jgi:hypothetical protein
MTALRKAPSCIHPSRLCPGAYLLPFSLGPAAPPLYSSFRFQLRCVTPGLRTLGGVHALWLLDICWRICHGRSTAPEASEAGTEAVTRYTGLTVWRPSRAVVLLHSFQFSHLAPVCLLHARPCSKGNIAVHSTGRSPHPRRHPFSGGLGKCA